MSKVKNIGVFGRRNSGKSSLINIISGEDVAIVSDIPGTTTDPVKKRMEVFGIGPVSFIDTAGIDDSGELGEQRVTRTKRIISQIDLALLLYTDNKFEKFEKDLLSRFKKEEIPVIIIHNQSDIIEMDKDIALELTTNYGADVLEFSCNLLDEEEQKGRLETLIALIVKNIQGSPLTEIEMFDGLIEEGDSVVLVCPIDSEAPEGRLILPQVNAIRNVLDNRCSAVVLQPFNLPSYFQNCDTLPKLVVTDSQAFEQVSAAVPEEVDMTGFSVLLARAKSNFEAYLKGTPHIDKLKGGDRVLILESCSHHATCDDIGRVKLPKLLQKRCGCRLDWDVVAGLDSIERDIHDYAMVIQCGGCMITRRQLLNRLKPAIEAGIPVSNYGMALAWCMGIYERATRIFRR